jgi:PAS domain S-box-containing protein
LPVAALSLILTQSAAAVMTSVGQVVFRSAWTAALHRRTIDAMSAQPQPIELRTVLEHVGVPSLIADGEGTVTWLNGAARELVGDIRGKPFVSIVAPDSVPVVEAQLRRKLEGEPSTDYEIDVITPDRRRRRVEISSVRIENGDQCHAIFGIGVPGPVRAAPSVQLTPRQLEILRRLGRGQSTEEIASGLHLSKETVRNHIRHILRAFGAHSRLGAVARAHDHGLLG